MRAWADGRRAFRPFVEQTDAPFWRGLSSPRGEKMPIPYARPVIDDKGYGVECPRCGHISRASLTAPHDCGMCDAPLRHDGVTHGHHTWVCTRCDWWHIDIDCCEGQIEDDVTKGAMSAHGEHWQREHEGG